MGKSPPVFFQYRVLTYFRKRNMKLKILPEVTNSSNVTLTFKDGHTLSEQKMTNMDPAYLAILANIFTLLTHAPISNATQHLAYQKTPNLLFTTCILVPVWERLFLPTL